MSDTLEQEIRHLRALYWSDRDPEGRAFAPLADACLRAGRTDEAEELLQDGRSRLPGFLPGHLISARLHQASGDLDRAEASYRAAHELDPENSEVLLGLGRILAGRGLEEGVEMVERARALDPTVGRGDRPVVPERGKGPGPDSADLGSPEPAGETVSDDRPEDIPAVSEFAPAEIEDFGSPWDFDDDGVISVSDLAPDEESPTGVVGEETPVEESLDVEPPEPAVTTSSDGVEEGTESEAPVDVEVPETPDEEEADAPVPVEASVTDTDRNPVLESTDEDTDPVVTTRTLAELFVRQGLTERAIEVYERLLARNPGDESLRARVVELGAEAPERSDESDSGEVPGGEGGETGSGIELPERHIAPDAPSFGGSVDTTDPEDTDPHVPSAPDPHPEDPTPFGWAETDEEPAQAALSETSIATYLGRLLAFTPGRAGEGPGAPEDVGATDPGGPPESDDGERLDDALFDSWEDRS